MLVFQETAGGLVSGLSAYLDSLKNTSRAKSEYIWVGWPGITVDRKTKAQLQELTERSLGEFHAYPVLLTARAMEKFYQGFCNKTIWPLFHYFPSHCVYDEALWLHYKGVNRIFCDAVVRVIKPDDVIWIHDYHLMLLPRLLREKLPDIPIGFFLHVPFPSFETFRLLPMKWRIEILEGLLGADLIGFHTYEYTQYFLHCVLRILGHEQHMGQILSNNHVAKADTFPMGIDFQKFNTAPQIPEVQKEKDEIAKALSSFKIILSVDRLDYTKAILNRLQGYELFLQRNPQYHNKVVLLLVVVPSRIGVEHYQQMKKQIDELVGKINGRFASVSWTPVVYQYKFVPFYPLAALYMASDVALITPLRDGMNLIAKEYVASRTDRTGVLILSEMAGASKELGEAIIINPNDIEGLAEALRQAVEMPSEKQIVANRMMQNRLKRYDVVRWANEFLDELNSVKDQQKKLTAKLLGSSVRERLVKDFQNARKKLIFLDYDGTLVGLAAYAQLAKPSAELLRVLERLSQGPGSEIIVVSGRDKNTLESWFGTLDMGLVAEHGVWVRERGQSWHLIKPLANDWKPRILPVLEMYADRLPGAFVEEKEYSVTWHYRRADPELACVRARELIDDLINFTANVDVQILQGNKVVEVRCAGVNKGTAGMFLMAKDNFEFSLAIGDDYTDEELFKVLPETAYSIRIGMDHSYAKYHLRSPSEAITLLEQLAIHSIK